MNQIKKKMFNQEHQHNLEMNQMKKNNNQEIKNLINKFQHQETMLGEEIRVQLMISQFE